MMAANAFPKTMPDRYFKLVQAFPLAPIRDGDHLAEAAAVIDGLLQEELDAGGQAYLDVLTHLVESYEDAHVLIPDASEIDVLRELMRARGLSQGRLAKEARIAQSTLSAVLTGVRKLTREHVIKLAAYFKVPAAVFLPAQVR